MRIGLNSPQAFFALLIRRRWWIVLPFLALSGLVVVVAKHLPKLYVSETLVLVRPRDVTEDFVVDLIAGTVGDRLKSIEQIVLSRKNLVQIIQDFGAELPELRRMNMDDAVEALRDQIDIQYYTGGDKREPTVTYFRISYQNRDPKLAQKICRKITQIFIEEDNRTRENQVSGTRTFLVGALEKVSEELLASETRLKDMRASRQFELPERLESNFRRMETLTQNQRTTEEALGRHYVLKLNLEQLLADTPRMIQKIQPVLPNAATPVKAPPVNPRIAEYLKAKQAFEVLESKPAGNPDRQRAQLALDKARAKLAPEEFDEAERPPDSAPAVAPEPSPVITATEPNPRYQSVMASLREAEKELEILQNQKTAIAAEIAKYGSRIDNTPQTEQELADVLRQTTELQKRHAELSDKLSQAELSQQLETEQKAGQFDIVDPANEPLDPSKPNKKMVAMGGVAMSLALALAFAIVVDVSRQRIWTESEVEGFWGVPVLVDIPEILIDSDIAAAQKKKRVFFAALVAGSALYLVCLGAVYAKHEFVLRQLDPVLQKVIYKK